MVTPDAVFDTRVCTPSILRMLAPSSARQKAENQEKLKKTIERTEINLMNPARPGKKLLVLDLDHTLLDFKDQETHKRPHCIQFLRKF
jgi:predicted HAD superfamily phosphohydrolase YqeG